MAIYNSERPMSFDEVLGQEKVTKTFEGILKSKKIPNAFLFVGTRGTGKTSSARLWARYLNCEHPIGHGPCNECPSCKAALEGNSMDIIELDAASNNGVADIHRVLEMADYAPVGKRKVVILDEVHMLSQAAFNVLLKPFEDGSNAFFILCTTEEHKVPAAITSRCSKFIFEQIADDVIVGKLEEICNKYGKQYEDTGLELIARAAKGGMRDSQSILEQFMSEDCITENLVKERLGITDEGNIFSILKGIVTGKFADAVISLRELQKKGKSMAKLVKDLQSALIRTVAYIEGDTDVKGTSEYIDGLKSFVAVITDVKILIPLIEEISNIIQSLKTDEDIALSLQSIIATASLSAKADIELEKRVLALEEEVKELKANGVKLAGMPSMAETTNEPRVAAEESNEPSMVINVTGNNNTFAANVEEINNALPSNARLVSFEESGLGEEIHEFTLEGNDEFSMPAPATVPPVDGFEMGDAISLDALLGEETPKADATNIPEGFEVAEKNPFEVEVEPKARPMTTEDGFVKGEAISLDELIDEVKAEESVETKDIKEEEPTEDTSDDSDESDEPAPTINLFANMFGGFV